MTYDLSTALTEFMSNNDSEIVDNWFLEDETMQKLSCLDIKLGEWIDRFELPVLLEMLTLPDRYFYQRFNGLRSFTSAKRREFGSKLQMHGEACPRCRTKILLDKKWEKIIDDAVYNFRQDSQMNSNIRDNSAETCTEEQHLYEEISVI
jgi:Zn-finger nucleic acid-binding protein